MSIPPTATPLQLSDIANVQDLSNQIINTELTRVQQKQDGLNNERDTRRRNIKINQSYVRRMRQYAYMVGVIVISLTICAILAAMNSVFPLSIFNIATVIVIAVGAVWSYYIYMDIQKHDLLDFDQVSDKSLINPVPLITTTTASNILSGKTTTVQYPYRFSFIIYIPYTLVVIVSLGDAVKLTELFHKLSRGVDKDVISNPIRNELFCVKGVN